MNNFQQGCTVDGAAVSENPLQKFIEGWSHKLLGKVYSSAEDIPISKRQCMINAMEKAMGQEFHNVRECSELQDIWNEAKWKAAGKKFRTKTDSIAKEYGISRDELFDISERLQNFKKAKENIMDKTTNKNVLKFLKKITYDDLFHNTNEKFVKYMKDKNNTVEDFMDTIIFELRDRIFMGIDSKELFPDLQFIIERTKAKIIKFRKEFNLDEFNNTSYATFLIYKKEHHNDDDKNIINFAKGLVDFNIKAMKDMGVSFISILDDFSKKYKYYDVDGMIQDIVEFDIIHKEASRL